MNAAATPTAHLPACPRRRQGTACGPGLGDSGFPCIFYVTCFHFQGISFRGGGTQWGPKPRKPQQPCPVGPLPRGTNQKAGTPDVNEMVCVGRANPRGHGGRSSVSLQTPLRPPPHPHAGQSPEGSARKPLGPGAGTLAPRMAGTVEWGGAPRFHPHGKASSKGKDQGLPPCLPKLPLKSQQSKRLCTLPCGEHPTAATLPSAHRVARAPAPFLHTGNKFRGSCSTSSPSRGSERGPSSAWPSRRLSGEQSPPTPTPSDLVLPMSPIFGQPLGWAVSSSLGWRGAGPVGGAQTPGPAHRPPFPAELRGVPHWHRLAGGSPQVGPATTGPRSSSCGSIRPQQARKPSQAPRGWGGQGLQPRSRSPSCSGPTAPARHAQGPLACPALLSQAWSVATSANMLNGGGLALSSEIRGSRSSVAEKTNSSRLLDEKSRQQARAGWSW